MKIFILMFILLISSAHAFNWDRCHNSQPVSGNAGGIFEFSSTVLSNSAVGTTQGVSSWGDCSLIGKAESVRKTFIAQNFSQLHQEMAKGNGEYLAAYARTHQCSVEGQKIFAREMKKYFFEIEKTDFEGVFEIMEAPFQGLTQYCPLT